MAITLEVRERHKHHLNALLVLKRDNKDREIIGLQQKISDAVVVMEQEDVALVEKIVGVKAL
ncbi:MAG: hypothetical protein FWB96_00425 [Defluviitaleaceae bacterium]|nr:hypothetical protein [Defluviitaleaceae bacterium]MCL2261822.1 hypothetical protein [Defluviitaleaceae bacterium]